MANPVGVNGGLFVPEPAYGDVGKQQQMLREAPISGAPVSTAALEAPRRAGKRGSGRGPKDQQAAEQVAGSVVPPPPDYQSQLASVWQQLASTPGAGPNIQAVAAQVASGR